MSASILEVRNELATALASVGASVYGSVPEAVIPPACVIVPDAPYLESRLIGGATVNVKINFICIDYNRTTIIISTNHSTIKIGPKTTKP